MPREVRSVHDPPGTRAERAEGFECGSGREVGRASTATMLDGPFGAAAFLLRNLSDRGIAPEAGWWVSSGAITGVHEIAPGQRAIARFAGVGQTEAVMQAG